VNSNISEIVEIERTKWEIFKDGVRFWECPAFLKLKEKFQLWKIDKFG
jgi:hypothetical protein